MPEGAFNSPVKLANTMLAFVRNTSFRSIPASAS